MAKKDAYFFPHFSNARHDRKVKRIVKELGVEGYGIYFMLLEVLREQTDLRYPLEDIDLLADEFKTSEQKVRTVVCNYKLFDVDESQNFFSMKLVFYLQPYFEKSERARVAANKRWENTKKQIAHDANALQEHNASTANAMQREYTKGEEVHSASEVDNFFEKHWSLYPSKKGKGRISNTQKKKLYKLGDEFERCINRYIEYAKSLPYAYNYQNGSTFFNSGYVDYLDKNHEAPKQQGLSTTPQATWTAPPEIPEGF